MTDKTDTPVPGGRDLFHRDRMEYWAFVAQIVSAMAVIVSLVFVGIQLRDGNRVAARDEANATQQQWTAFRNSIYGNRDTAELFVAGMAGDSRLDAAGQLRFLYIMREHAWATYQLWERVDEGLSTPEHFTLGAGPDFLRVICTPGGRVAWAGIKAELPRPFVAELDRMTPDYARAHKVGC